MIVFLILHLQRVGLHQQLAQHSRRVAVRQEFEPVRSKVMMEALTADVPVDRADHTDEQDAQWLPGFFPSRPRLR
jgi:hypothetical protein